MDTYSQTFSLLVTLVDAQHPAAVITLNGNAYLFDPVDGIELDPYYDPQGEFVQQCFVCTHPGLPDMTVFYRPDLYAAREEWIFELGSTTWTPQANLPAYTVDITRKDGTTVHAEAPSGHYWFARWRWQSEPRPVRRGYETLANQNLIPHLDTEGLAKGPILSVSSYIPMSTCGMPQNQGQTGGYPGLGILTGWLAQYLVRGAPENSWRAQAEAINSYPTSVRDPATYAPVDIVSDYPGMNMYSASEGSPFIPKGPSPTRTDQGHLPSTVYVPYLLTGDPYYLEAMQLTCNYQQLSLPSDSRVMVCGRYLAWPTRAVAELVAACPDTVPSWLLPKSYWVHWLDRMRGYIEDRMMNTSDPTYWLFHSIPDGGPSSDLDPSKSGDHVWQQCMLDLVAAWVASFRDEWLEPAEWCIHSCIDRASATSGWVRTHPSPYHMRLQHASVLNEAMTKTDAHFVLQYPQTGFRKGVSVKIDNETFILDGSVDGCTWTFEPRTAPADHPVKRPVYGPMCTSWPECSELNVTTYGWNDVADNDHLPAGTADLTYPSYQRAALAQAIHAGLNVPGLQDAFTWIDQEIRAFVASGLPVGDNWCVAPAPASHRSRHRRSERTDPRRHPWLQAILDKLQENTVPGATADPGKVRLGAFAPTYPPEP